MIEARILRNDSIHEIEKGNSSCRDSDLHNVTRLESYNPFENQITSFVIDFQYISRQNLSSNIGQKISR